MPSTVFDRNAWLSVCQDLEVSCADRSLSPMHALFLFSQAIDDALQAWDLQQVGEAFDIARSFGYESSLERTEFVHWFTGENAVSGRHVGES